MLALATCAASGSTHHTPPQRDFSEAAASFRTNGFVVVRRLFDAAEAAHLGRDMEDYVRDVVPSRSSESCFFDGDGAASGELALLKYINHPGWREDGQGVEKGLPAARLAAPTTSLIPPYERPACSSSGSPRPGPQDAGTGGGFARRTIGASA